MSHASSAKTRLLAALAFALVTAACAEEPVPPTGERYPGERLELQPQAVWAGQRDKDGDCDYSWLAISGRADDYEATVFVPFRRKLGAKRRCEAQLGTEIAALIQAEIDDGDREPIVLCVKDLPEIADLEIPAGDRRLESVELLVSGWYFRKPVFWTCDTESGCPPPDSCGLLDGAPDTDVR